MCGGPAQGDRDGAVGHVDAFDEVAHGEARAFDVAGVLGCAEAAAEARAGVQPAAEAPAGRQPRPPGGQVVDAQLADAFKWRLGRRPGLARGRPCSRCRRQDAERRSRSRSGEMPDARVRSDAEAEVREAEALARDLVGDRQVAARPLDDHVDADAGRTAHLHVRPHAQVAAPAESRLQRLQDRCDGDRVDFRLRIEARRRACGPLAPVDAVPAHARAKHLRAAGLERDVQRRARPRDAAAHVARVEPGPRRRGQRARCGLANRAAPAAGTAAVDIDEAAFGDDGDHAARAW